MKKQNPVHQNHHTSWLKKQKNFCISHRSFESALSTIQTIVTYENFLVEEAKKSGSSKPKNKTEKQNIGDRDNLDRLLLPP